MEYTPKQYYEMYRDFKGMLVNRANAITMHISNTENIKAACKIADLDAIHAVLFAQYINKYWHAYCWDIIQGEYNYINMTSMVWESFKEHMAK